MPRNYDLLETIKIKRSMSASISEVDADYSDYAGADLPTAEALAKIKFCLQEKILPEALTPLLQLGFDYLQQKRKAFFASVGSDVITKLGFIQGAPQKELDAQEEVDEN